MQYVCYESRRGDCVEEEREQPEEREHLRKGVARGKGAPKEDGEDRRRKQRIGHIKRK